MSIIDKSFFATDAAGRRRSRRRWLHIIAGIAAFVALTGGTVSGCFAKDVGSSWQPGGTVQFIVPSTASGSLDMTARSLKRLWQKDDLVKASIIIQNKPGGGHAVALNFLSQHKGDANYIQVESPNLLLSHIVGRSAVTYTGVTPVCVLFTDYMAFAVRADSPIKTGKDLVERLKKDPQSLSIALSSAVGGTHHLATALVLRAGGVDIRKLKLVAFQSSSKAVTALLGGHVDVAVASPSNVMAYMPQKLRVIAVSSPKRLPGAFSSVPTWKEQGYDAMFANWRGIIAPKGISDSELGYWQGICQHTAQLDGFKKMLTPHMWVQNYMGHTETVKFMKDQYDQLKGLLVELGLVKKK